jgi:uncharacterized coiled-coil protein SlyX
MNKLHSLIDHLKEQEKGYMDLLRTFSKFQSINSNLYSFVGAKDSEKGTSNGNLSRAAFQRDVLDLSELNESLANQQKEQKQQQSSLPTILNSLLQRQETSHSASGTDKAVQVEEASMAATEASCSSSGFSIGGSFISDTLTLNGIKCDKKGLVKYSKKEAQLAADATDTDELTEDDKTEADELTEDEYTYDVNPDTEVFSKFVQPVSTATAVRAQSGPDRAERERYQEQRKEVYDALDSDMVTLEQMKEQKSLLNSIRLRKEELKALEGRRVALEALRKMANQSEMQLDGQAKEMVGIRSSISCGAVDSMDNPGQWEKTAKMASFVEETIQGEDTAESKLKQVSDLCRFLDMLKEKQVGLEFSDSRRGSVPLLFNSFCLLLFYFFLEGASWRGETGGRQTS